MQPIQLPAAAAALLKHLQRSGLTHLPQAEPLPAELTAAWWTSADPQPSLAPAIRSATPQVPAAAPPLPATAFPATASPPVGHAAPPQSWSTAAQPAERRGLLLEQLCQEVAACQRCPNLVSSRSRTVFGDGPVTPRVVFFGEAPGADEDRAGIPFVGRAGQLLDKIIAATGMQRSEVYILNAVKCRPQNNRTPEEEEVSNCRPYFERQLELLQPDFLVLLGAVAVRAVLGSQAPIGRLRGSWYAYRGAKTLVTYHPAYLLRNEASKRLTWEDMKMLMREMGLPIPPAAGRRG
jgi:uracil-DNA glycosylase